MKLIQEQIHIQTPGRGSHNVTRQIEQCVHSSGIGSGLCTLFLQHTSASIILCENADPAVRTDLERYMLRLVPDGDPMFEHIDEGPDDMPAHIRSILTQNHLTIPLQNGRLALGTWQGIYLWEHRHAPHRRHIHITLLAAE